MTVVPYEQRRLTLTERESSLLIAARYAEAIAATDFVPQGLRNNPAAIAAAILYGDEVGLGPMQSLAKIAVINGRPTLAAEAQRALIHAAGHEFWVEEANTTRCTVAGRRRDSEQTQRVTWTLDDAKRAGIAGKDPWRKYPRQMLVARATAQLAREAFADAIGGLAATEEVEHDDLELDENGVVQIEPSTQGRRRRRASVSTPQTSADAAPPPEPERPPLPGDDDDGPAAGAAETGTESVVVDPHSGDAPVSAMTDAQRKRLMAAFREQGFLERPHRLAWTRVVVGRPVDSSAELTSEEASYLIERLEGLGRGGE